MKKQQAIRALIVEDDTLVGELIQGLLGEIGHTVAGKAKSGREAVEMTTSLRPDVVLMDIEMPDVNGIETTRCILERCPTPVVMVTAHETADLVAQASEAGVGAYLVKPPGRYELERAIIIAMARFEDMMELKSLNAELLTRIEELDAFAHTVAHDLHGPLGLMAGYAEILEQEHASLPPAELQTYLHDIAINGRKLSRIVDALLLLASVHQTAVEVAPLKMADIVAEALQRLRPLIDEYRPDMRLPDIWPESLGYAPWIEEVWTNYLSNAIKYGGRPPRIELGVTGPVAGMIRFWIQDNGSGVTAEEQARLFTPFTRLDRSRARGHGLGLSIVRRIVEKLGGEVGVESDGIPGRGSIFSFTLPGTIDHND